MTRFSRYMSSFVPRTTTGSDFVGARESCHAGRHMSTPLSPSHRAALRRRRGRGSARRGPRRRAAGHAPAAEATARPHGRWGGAERPAAPPRGHPRGGGPGRSARPAAPTGATRRRRSRHPGRCSRRRASWRDVRAPGRPGGGHRRGDAARHPAARLRARPRRRARPAGHPHRGPLVGGAAGASPAPASREVVDGSDARRARERCPASPCARHGRAPRCWSARRRKVPASLDATLAVRGRRPGAGRRAPTRAPPRTPWPPCAGRRTSRCSPSVAGFGPPARFAQRVRTATARPRAARRRVAALPGAPDGRALRPPADRGARHARRAVGRPGRAAGQGAGRRVRRPHRGRPSCRPSSSSRRWPRARPRRTAPTRGARRCAPCCRGSRPPSAPASTSCSTSSRGATDFLTQARAYEELLRRPVGRARARPGVAPAARAEAACARSVSRHRRGQPGRCLAGRPRARARPAAQGADPAPVQPGDDP